MIILCVKIFKMKSYGMEFISKKVLLQVYDNYGLLEIPSSKNSYHIETSQLICKVNQLTGFYMTLIFTDRSSRTDIKSYTLCGFNNNY